MKIVMQHTFFLLLIVILSVAPAYGWQKEPSAHLIESGGVGFQQVLVSDPEGQPLQVAIWYPSASPASLVPLGLFQQRVAVNGVVSGNRLPLILISHGTGGSLASHYDTALALTQAG